MVARLNRPRPLPEATQPRVGDSSTQRAFDLLFVPVREIIRFLQPFVQQRKWTALPYQGSWADVPSASITRGSYRKDPLARVWLRGTVYRTAVDNIIATLPLGHRPSRTLIFNVMSAGAATRVDVKADGTVEYVSGGAPAAGVALDGISFDTEHE